MWYNVYMSGRRILLSVLAVLVLVAINAGIAVAPENAVASRPVGTVDTEPRAFTEVPNSPNPNVIYQEINMVRTANGLQPLKRNELLTQLAEERAADMSTNSYYAHKGSNGLVFDQMLASKGYGINYGCENLNLDFTTAANTYVATWLASQPHKKCILNPTVTDAGYAVARIAQKGNTNVSSYVVVAIHTTTPLSSQ